MRTTCIVLGLSRYQLLLLQLQRIINRTRILGVSFEFQPENEFEHRIGSGPTQLDNFAHWLKYWLEIKNCHVLFEGQELPEYSPK